MSKFGTAFSGSVPEFYDRYLVPNIFEDYSKDIAARAAARAPSSLLELACGTGVVSRDLRAALPETCAMTCSDLNEPMLEIAKQKLSGSQNVDVKIVDAMNLPFEDDVLDLIVCQFGVMFFPDKVASYKEARRVLKPGGAYLFNVWDRLAENPFANIANRLAQEMFPADPPQFYEVPFHYHDPAQIEDDLRKGGFTNVTLENYKIEKEVKSLDDFAEGLVFGNPLAEELKARGTEPEKFQERLRAELAKAFGEKPSVMMLSAWFILARP